MAVFVARRQHDPLLALDDHQLALHLVGLDAAAAALVRVVQEPDQQQALDDQRRDRGDQAPLNDEALATVGEKEREPDGYERP